MNKRWRNILWVLGILIFLSLIFALGPKVPEPDFSLRWPVVSSELSNLEANLHHRESVKALRPGNEARVIWADSVRKTKWVIIYLHGFSASAAEGAPLHQQTAERYNFNLYLSRLAGHGYRTDCLKEYSAEAGWESAKRALAEARLMGDSVLIMGTSTGCTYALMLAAYFPEKVQALVNLSTNIRIKDPAAFLLNGPWGSKIAEMIIGPQRYVKPDTALYGQYWDTLYSTQALIELQSLLESQMQEALFAKVRCPSLSLYYYKNEQEQDQVVSVEKIRWMHEHLSTPPNAKVLKAIPEAGDHVLASPIKSKAPEAVKAEVWRFVEKQLNWQPAKGRGLQRNV